MYFVYACFGTSTRILVSHTFDEEKSRMEAALCLRSFPTCHAAAVEEFHRDTPAKTVLQLSR